VNNPRGKLAYHIELIGLLASLTEGDVGPSEALVRELVRYPHCERCKHRPIYSVSNASLRLWCTGPVVRARREPPGTADAGDTPHKLCAAPR